VPTISSYNTLEDVILTIFAIVVVIVLIWCLYSFFSAIFFLVFSWGKDDQKKKWWNSLRFMIIGLLIFATMLIGFPYILKSMNVELTQEYSVKKVFVRAWDMFKQVFKIGTIIKDSQKENEYRGNLFYDLNNKDTPTKSQYEL
jgi:energy-coupling factor transporter transmembrane protein EcfT